MHIGDHTFAARNARSFEACLQANGYPFAIQPQKLYSNTPSHVCNQIPKEELGYGVRIREPLAEGFGLRDFLMKGSPFVESESKARRDFYCYKRSIPVPERAAPYLSGELFDGDYTPHGQQYRFHFG